jgi:hypothetical protein
MVPDVIEIVFLAIVPNKAIAKIKMCHFLG